jgi:hypothetical protein
LVRLGSPVSGAARALGEGRTHEATVGVVAGALRAHGSVWGCRPTRDVCMGMATYGWCRHRDGDRRVKRSFRALAGIVELHSTPPPVGPAEDDDCKSSIPGCRCSATSSGGACGRPDEPGRDEAEYGSGFSALERDASNDTCKGPARRWRPQPCPIARASTTSDASGQLQRQIGIPADPFRSRNAWPVVLPTWGDCKGGRSRPGQCRHR